MRARRRRSAPTNGSRQRVLWTLPGRAFRASVVLALLVGIALAVAGPDAAMAQTGPKKPKPPVGRDPGGVAVAIIGAGVDYRRPEIAQRLARDGEGEIIGWDMIDNDQRPLETAAAAGPGRRVPPFAGTRAAELLLAEAPASRLVPVRMQEGDAMALGGALAFASRTPARVAVVLASPRQEPWALFAEAARRAKQLLVIVPAGRASDRGAWRGARGLDAAIVVTAAAEDGSLHDAIAQTPEGADVAVPVAAMPAGDAGTEPETAAENAAALRLGALAARVLGREPSLDGAALKARLLGLATPRPQPPAWIAAIGEMAR